MTPDVNKPCPFCRETDNTIRALAASGQFVVVCNACKASGPPRHTADEAKFYWINTRPNDRTVVPEGDEIAGIILASNITMDHLAAGELKALTLICAYDHEGKVVNGLSWGCEHAVGAMLDAYFNGEPDTPDDEVQGHA